MINDNDDAYYYYVIFTCNTNLINETHFTKTWSQLLSVRTFIYLATVQTVYFSHFFLSIDYLEEK